MQHTFQEEVRRALTKYALMPVLILAVLGTLLMLFSWRHYVTGTNHEQRAVVADVMQGIFAGYWQRTERAVATLKTSADLAQWQADPKMRAEIYGYLYHEVNITHDGTQFYLLDREGRVLLGSSDQLPAVLQPFYPAGGILQRMAKQAEAPVIEFVTRGDTGVHDLLVGQAVRQGGQITGWFFFVIPGEYLQRNITSDRLDFVVADSFDNAQITAGASYAVQMNKVAAPFRLSGDGLVQLKGREYYVTSQQFVSHGDGHKYRVYAVSPVTDLLLRYLLGAGLLLGGVLIMIPIILVSVRRESCARSKAVGSWGSSCRCMRAVSWPSSRKSTIA